jgi:hypothetical protein
MLDWLSFITVYAISIHVVVMCFKSCKLCIVYRLGMVSFQLGDKVSSTRFQGCIEEVDFDGIPVGLWNFVNGENNMDGCHAR